MISSLDYTEISNISKLSHCLLGLDDVVFLSPCKESSKSDSRPTFLQTHAYLHAVIVYYVYFLVAVLLLDSD